MTVNELQEQIKNQFISIYDSVLFVAQYGQSDLNQAFNLIKAKLLDKQIYLLLIDEFHLEQVKLFEDDYAGVEYDGKYITIDFIKSEIGKSIEQQKSTEDIKNYGFGAKRFYETLDIVVDLTIPEEFILDALSPDCYHDNDNPLTTVVHNLQQEIKKIKSDKKKNDTFLSVDNSSDNQQNQIKTLTTEKAQLQTELEQAHATIAKLKEQLAQAEQVTPADGEELKGLSKVNADKGRAKNTVKAFAKYLWQMDKDKKIRTGDMTQQVKLFMLAVGNNVLPDNDDSLKSWFADVRPEYAKKSGRKSNNAPREIPLTMKL